MLELDARQLRFLQTLIQSCVDESVEWLHETESMEERRRCNEVLAICSTVNRKIGLALEAGKAAAVQQCRPARTLVREFVKEGE